MTYLDLDATQAADLARGERVERWVQMEPQPREDATEVFVWFAGDLRNAPNGCAEDGVYFVTRRGLRYLGPVPHPPGTRARVREPWKSLAREDTKIEIVFYASGTAIYFCGDPINDGQNRYWGPWEYRDRRKEVLPEQEASTMPDWAIRMSAVCKSVTPEHRDGAWGFVEGWEVVR